MQSAIQFLSGYSDNFRVALIAWPIASLILTLPILAFLYHRDGRLRLMSTVGAYLSVLYLLGLLCFTLYPRTGSSEFGIVYNSQPELNPLHFINDIRNYGFQAVAQFVANVVLFVPLGYICGRGLRMGAFSSTCLGLLVSLFIETSQLTGLFGIFPYAYRVFDVDDLITNTIGALLGWIFARISLHIAPSGSDDQIQVTTNPGLVRRLVALCLDIALMAILVAIVWSVLALADYVTDSEQLSSMTSVVVEVAAVVVLVIVELLVPWARDGQTPGGSFVHMTCETRQRSGGRRFVFYLVRLLVIACLLGVFFHPDSYIAVVPLACIVFYLFMHKMPYDLI
jgi:glycopeptide antibiotics resistance protein